MVVDICFASRLWSGRSARSESFGGEPPMEFWRFLVLYISSNTLGSLAWAASYDADEVRIMCRQAADVLSWYRGLTNVVPSWYRDR